MTATRKEKISLYLHHPIDEYIKPRRWKNIVPFLTYAERSKEALNTMAAYFVYLLPLLLLLGDSLIKESIPKTVYIIVTVLLALDLMRRYRTLYINGRTTYRPFLGLWNFYVPTTASILSILILLIPTSSFIRAISAGIVLANIPIFAIYFVRTGVITEKQEHVKSISSFVLLLLFLSIPTATLFFITYASLQQIDALTTLQEILLSSVPPSIFLGWLYQNRKTSIEHYLPTHKKLFESIPELIKALDSKAKGSAVEHFISTVDTDMRATASPKLIDQWDFFVTVLKLSNTNEDIPLKKYATARFLDASRIFVGLNSFLHFPWQTWHYKPLAKLYTYCELPSNPPKNIRELYWEKTMEYSNNPHTVSIPLIVNSQHKVLVDEKGQLLQYRHALFEGPRLTLLNHPLITQKTTVKKIDSVLQNTDLPATNVTYYTVTCEKNALSKGKPKGHTWKQLDETNFPAELLPSFLSSEDSPKKSKRYEVKSKVLNFLWPQKS